jgi:hypothetical protein
MMHRSSSSLALAYPMCCLEKIIMSESQERSAALRDLVEKWRATARTHGRYVTHRGKNDAVAIAHQSKSGRLSRCDDELEAILLREAAASLSPPVSCSCGTTRCQMCGSHVAPQPAPAPQKGEQEISDPMTNPTSPGELPIETEIYGVLDTLAITCGHSEAQALARYIRERIAREAAALLTEQSRRQEAWRALVVKLHERLEQCSLYGPADAVRDLMQQLMLRVLPAPPQPKEPR